MRKNPSKNEGGDLPVENVSWDDVKEYIRRINSKFRPVTFRLPTEAEWEFVCVSSNESRNPNDFEEELLDRFCWFRLNSERESHPVGLKNPNYYGVYDLLGNVWEWCEDTYTNNNSNLPKNGKAYYVKNNPEKVAKGGSYLSNANRCQVSSKKALLSWEKRKDVGFRLVISER